MSNLVHLHSYESNRLASGSPDSSELDIKEIAKLVRTDVRHAIKKGSLGGASNVSVKINRQYNALELQVVITSYTGKVFNPEYTKATKNYDDHYNEAVYQIKKNGSIHSMELQSVKNTLREIVNSYTTSPSNKSIDTRYSIHIGIAMEINDSAQLVERVTLD